MRNIFQSLFGVEWQHFQRFILVYDARNVLLCRLSLQPYVIYPDEALNLSGRGQPFRREPIKLREVYPCTGGRIWSNKKLRRKGHSSFERAQAFSSIFSL